MGIVKYTDGSASAVEYESVDYSELTSCYTYNSLFTALQSQQIGVKSTNFMQWISPNEVIKFEKSVPDSYVDIIWILGAPRSASGEGTVIIPTGDKINVITKMKLSDYRLVIDTLYTTLDVNGPQVINTRDAQTYVLVEHEKIIGCAYHWENINDGKTLETITAVIRYTDANGEQILFYPHSITQIAKVGTTQSNGFLLSSQVAHSSANTIYLNMFDVDERLSFPSLRHQFKVGGDDDISVMWYNATQNNTELFYTFSSDKFKSCLALLGVYFKIENTEYLGFMDASGQTTGEYLTSDKWRTSAQYNSDSINNYTEHTPPYVPPAPGGDDDIEKDMSAGVGYYDAGMIRYYFTETTSTLELISSALGNWDNIETGKDVLKNLISLKCFAVPAQTESAGGIIRGFPEDFVIAGTKLKKSSTSSEVIQMKRITSVQNIPLEGIYISPRYNDFRDYAPYTKLEIYVPFCGWLPLPSHCMDKTVSGTICFDYINGSCVAHIYCGQTEVGQISGYIGIDLPFVAENVGVKMAGVVSGMTAIGSSVIGTAAGLATGNALGAAAGGLGLINSITQTIQANNANYTEVHGRTADGCNASGLKSVFIKIQRPISHVPANYGATVGYVANTQQTLSACSGLTVCSNVDTDGIAGATASEQQEIKALLQSGIRV